MSAANSYTQIDFAALEQQLADRPPLYDSRQDVGIGPLLKAIPTLIQRLRETEARLREAEEEIREADRWAETFKARIAQLERVRTEALKAPYFGPLADALDVLEPRP